MLWLTSFYYTIRPTGSLQSPAVLSLLGLCCIGLSSPIQNKCQVLRLNGTCLGRLKGELILTYNLHLYSYLYSHSDISMLCLNIRPALSEVVWALDTLLPNLRSPRCIDETQH
jgi:hypothetical protein